jgi:hypothetical protein
MSVTCAGCLGGAARECYSGSMSIDELRNHVKARPFVPFTVLVADGRSFRVPHEDFISQSPGGRTVIVYHGKVHTVLDALLITGLEVEQSHEQLS